MRWISFICCCLVFVIGNAQAVSESNSNSNDAKVLTDYFFAAARTNDAVLIETFVSEGFPIDIQNQKGYTALMVATYHGQQDAFDKLLQYDANPCVQDNRGNTALMAAIFRGELGMAYRLMKSDCNLKHENNAGQTAEAFARVFGRKDILQKLTAAQLVESTP
ncbi:ankyrin repeat domain-containing protein [Spongorhabdus nitratireducens]